MKLKTLCFIIFTQSLYAGVVMLDGKEVETSQPQPVKPVQRKTERVALTQVVFTVKYKDKRYQNRDELNEAAEQTLKAIKANLRDNICGQEFFGFEPYNCHLGSESCEFSFKSERCAVQDSLTPCTEGNPRMARGKGMDREFNFCVRAPGAPTQLQNPNKSKR